MRILALDGALARCSAAVWQDGTVLAEAMQDGARGHAAVLPALARDVLRRALPPASLPAAPSPATASSPAAPPPGAPTSDASSPGAPTSDASSPGASSPGVSPAGPAAAARPPEPGADAPSTRPDAVAVTVGPGGFTGLRAAIALAQGFAAGWGVPCIGVTVGEALLAALAAAGEPPLPSWVAVDTKRGRVALERPNEAPAVFALDDLPPAPASLLVLGDAAPLLREALAARGAAVTLGPALPEAAAVAAVAARRLRGELPPIEATEPLYLEPPAVRGG
ncbi:tRNA (adenosine(37)-N6)-threonylcarbamoyltransferase complex dimerization subunit type 1 TsaB [Roseomonas elaeocarpi]|uniref:tRNA (Adenosine(37)-N6)-threonylcarbamoyltransferase complex dimerization subunit type 1 TsaB n=1 Tax=Roseomonas elaeocarpi TaxID=907779 RepID=A0ABV6JY56_9PROT